MKSRVLLGLFASLSIAASWAQDATPSVQAESSAPSASVLPVAEALPPAPAKPGSGDIQKASSRFIDEVIVTAQKREENLRDVPISVAAFSAEALDARGITDSRELQNVTPGLNIGQQAGFTTVYLRGIGSDAYLMADPSVAYYIDGVYIPSAQGISDNFGAIDRVEILKGPQGTLFGRNAVGGAINVITKAPDFHKFYTQVQSGYNNFNTLDGKLHTNIPFSDSVAMSATAFYTKGDNFMEGYAGLVPLPREYAKGARTKLRFAPNERLDITLSAYRVIDNGAGTLFQLNVRPSLIGTTLGIKPQTGYSGEVSAPVFYYHNNSIYAGQATYNTDWLDIKLLYSDQFLRFRASYDYDGSPQKLVTMVTKDFISDVKTGELQLVSNDTSWGSDWLKWIGGAYYFKSEQGFKGFDASFLDVDIDGSNSNAFLDLPPNLLNALEALLNPFGLSTPSGTVSAVGLIGTKSLSFYAQTTASLTNWANLTLGARYQTEERYIIQSSSGLWTADNGVIPLLNFPNAKNGTNSNTTKSFKPKVSLDMHPAENTLVYFSYQQALKSATYNTLNIYLPPDYVLPEETTAYELGVKTNFLDHLVDLTAAVFQYDIKNIQVQYLSLLKGGLTSFENAGAARVRGADFDVMVQLFPSVFDALVFTSGGAFLDAVYTDYRHGTGFDNNTGIITTNNDFTGNRIFRTPRWSGSAALSKTWQIPGGPFELAGDLYYTADFYYAASNADATRQASYMLLGARASYLYESWNLRATVFGKNLTGEKYTTGALPGDFGVLMSLGAPVTYGMRLSWEF